MALKVNLNYYMKPLFEYEISPRGAMLHITIEPEKIWSSDDHSKMTSQNLLLL